MSSLSLSRKLLCLNIALLLCISVVSPAALAAGTDADQVFHYEQSLIIDGVEYDASRNQSGNGWNYRYNEKNDRQQLTLQRYCGGSVISNLSLSIDIRGNNIVSGSGYGIYTSESLSMFTNTYQGENGYLTVNGSHGKEAVYAAGELRIAGDITASGDNCAAIRSGISLNLRPSWPSTVMVGDDAQTAVEGTYRGQAYVSYTRKPYSLTLHANGGISESGESSKTIAFTTGTPGNLYLYRYKSIFTNGSQQLLGWIENTDESDDFHPIDEEYRFPSGKYEAELYALWEDDSNKAVILNNFYGQYGSSGQHEGDSVSCLVSKGDEFILPDQARTGCIFDGWLGEDGITTYSAGTCLTITESTSFTARFISLKLIINGEEYDASADCGSYGLGWHYYPRSATNVAQLDIYGNYSGEPLSVPSNVDLWLNRSIVGQERQPAIDVEGDLRISVSSQNPDVALSLIGGSDAPAIKTTGETEIVIRNQESAKTQLIVKSGGVNIAAIQAASVIDTWGYFYAGHDENSLSIVSDYNGEEYAEFADMSQYIKERNYINLSGETTVPNAPDESGYTFVAWREVTENNTSFESSRWYMPGDKVDAGEGIKLRPEYISSNGASAAIIIDGNGGETTYGSRYYVHYVSASELHPYPVVQHTSSADLQQYYRLPGNPFEYENRIFLSYNTSHLGSGTKYRPGDFLPEGNLIYRLYVQWMYRELDSVIARSEVELCGIQAPNGNRDSQTNHGNLITEAMRWKALNEGNIDVDASKVVAVTNGGGIRAAIAVGDVTRRDINKVLPFGNTVAVVYVTGAELLEALEASTYCTPTKLGGYPQTTGIKWTLNTTEPYDPNEEPYPDSSYHGPASIRRVTIESINGKPFNAADTYAVVTNDFCAWGGDTYYSFHRAYEEKAGFNTGVLLDDAVCEYIETELKGVISEKYATDRGDLTMITADMVTASGTMGNNSEISWSYCGYKRELTITGDKIGTDKPLYIAEYADSGKMLGVTVITDKNATISTKDKAKEVKLMWLDKEGEPICRPELIQSL